MRHFFWFVVGVLSTYRLTYMLSEEDGPNDIFIKFRKSLGIFDFDILSDNEKDIILNQLELPDGILPPPKYALNFWGQLVSCFNCLSIWIAFVVSLSTIITKKDILRLPVITAALSAGAMLVRDITAHGVE